MSPRTIAPLLLAMVTCRGTSNTRVSRNGIEVRRITVEAATRATAGNARGAMRGDWMLRDRDLRVTVVGTEGPARNDPPGTIAHVAFTPTPGVEVVRTLAPLLRVGQRDIPLSRVSLEAVLDGATPVLRVSGQARAAHQTLNVVRDYALETGRHALHVYTRVTNPGPARVERLSWGMRIEWGSATPFAPGMGVVAEDADGAVGWVGGAVNGLAAAWTPADRGRELSLRFVAEMHGSSANAGHTEALTRPVTITPEQTLIDHAVLLVAPGDLTDIARAVSYVREERVAEAALALLGDARDPSVTITDTEGRTVLIAQPRGGAATLPLAPGAYVARATAPGHAPSDAVPFRVSENSAGAVPVELSVPRGAHLRVNVQDVDTGRDLPARVTVRGVRPTPDPNLGPPDRAAGAGLIAITIEGRTEVPVPPGRYRVTVSHGPEWTLYDDEVSVTETMRADVHAQLRHVVPMPSWVGCDLHVHANPSFDSRVTIEDRVASLVAEGVGFATPTEHNVVGDYAAGVAMLPDTLTETLQWVPAVEVTTDRSAQPWGHFNVYPYHPDPAAPGGSPPPFLNTSPRQIFRAARANNPDAIIQVNHPRMQPNIGYFNVTGLDPRTGRAVSPEYDASFDAIEVFNGLYINRVEQVENVLQDWMSLLATGARYVATGSSDSHRVLYQWAGYPRTYVHADYITGDGVLHESAAILRALRGGRAFVTTGPMLFLHVRDAEPGDTVPVSPQEAVPVRVRVLAAPWMPIDSVEIYRDGARVATLAVGASSEVTRLDTEVTVQVSPGSFVLAVARGPRGGLNAVLPYSEGVPYALTNPVFFGAAGPRVATPRGR